MSDEHTARKFRDFVIGELFSIYGEELKTVPALKQVKRFPSFMNSSTNECVSVDDSGAYF